MIGLIEEQFFSRKTAPSDRNSLPACIQNSDIRYSAIV